MKTHKDDSTALHFLQTGWDSIPRRSWRNRNGAMSEMLKTAISSGMEFEPGDIIAIYKRFNAGYWIGESSPHFYSLACSAQSGTNTSAAIAWEKYLGQPPVLWAERTKYPDRLHVGSQFNWSGMRLTVTSMEKSHLIGCTYKEDRSIKNRVRVEYADIAEKRKAMDAAFRVWMKRIQAAETHEEIGAIAVELRAEDRPTMRHFDIEELSKAFTCRRKEINDSLSETQRRKSKQERDATHDTDLAWWMEGKNVPRHFDVVRLRIKGDVVETSTGHTASLKGVKAAIPLVRKLRTRGWKANGATMDLDEYPIKSVTKEGVQVGCTFVEWSEIDRIAALL